MQRAAPLPLAEVSAEVPLAGGAQEVGAMDKTAAAHMVDVGGDKVLHAPALQICACPMPPGQKVWSQNRIAKLAQEDRARTQNAPVLQGAATDIRDMAQPATDTTKQTSDKIKPKTPLSATAALLNAPQPAPHTDAGVKAGAAGAAGAAGHQGPHVYEQNKAAHKDLLPPGGWAIAGGKASTAWQRGMHRGADGASPVLALSASSSQSCHLMGIPEDELESELHRMRQGGLSHVAVTAAFELLEANKGAGVTAVSGVEAAVTGVQGGRGAIRHDRPAVLRRALQVLFILSIESDPIRRSIVHEHHRGMEVLLLAMREEVADAAHLARACAVLWSLAMIRGAPEAMAAAGAVNQLFDALRLHPDDAHLQHLGLMAAQVGFFFYAHLKQNTWVSLLHSLISCKCQLLERPHAFVLWFLYKGGVMVTDAFGSRGCSSWRKTQSLGPRCVLSATNGASAP